MSAKETKDRIIKCTTDLILERDGDIDNVTIRMIAARAGIGVGLANHYFQSKEQLVSECIDRVFSELFEMLTRDDTKKGADSGPADVQIPIPSDETSYQDPADAFNDRASVIFRQSDKAPSHDFSDAPEEIAGLLDFLDEVPEDDDLHGLTDKTGITDSSGNPELPDETDMPGGDDATHRAARAVMDFLIKNEAISRAALVKNTQNPVSTDYTARLTDAFAYAMADKKMIEEIRANSRMTERMKEQFIRQTINDKKIKSFMIMSSIKESLIRREALKENLQVDLADEKQRAEYIDSLLEKIY